MGLQDRDYMRGDDGEERARRYDDETREDDYDALMAKRQAQYRRGLVILFIIILVLFALAFLMRSLSSS